jgi:cytochrome c
MSRERRNIAAVAAGVLVLAGFAIDARAQDPAVRGRALLKELCASCHAIDKLDRSPLPAAPPFRVIGQSLELDRLTERLRDGLSSSHRDMPEFRFGEDDANAVVAFLRTIQE